MTEDRFWQLIADSKAAGGGDGEAQTTALRERLQMLPPVEIVDFYRHLHEQLDRSYRRELWAAAYIILGGCSDDAFDYFRAWLIAQGLETFEQALADPETLVEVAGPEAELELFMYAPIEAYEAVSKTDFPYPPGKRRELTGEEWEETAECLQRKFPRLFAKFWNAPAGSSEDGDMDLGAMLSALQGLAGDLSAVQTGAEALYTQATFLTMDESPEKLKEAAAKLQQAAEQGHAGAQYLLGTFRLEGHGVEQDHAAAAELFRRASEQGEGDACAALGQMYKDGLGVTQDYSEALKWYRRGVEAESADAAAGLAGLLQDGLGVRQDTKEALKWYRRAAQDGHDQSANNLGIAYTNGLGVKANPAEAARWFRQAAEAGFSEGQYNLGVLFEQGRGVAKDLGKAAELYRAAADQGHTNAQSNLGVFYNNGAGVPQDYAQAAELFQKAAAQGNLVALCNLAVLHQHGRGIPQNLGEAVRLYRQVAETGEAAGQFNLGTMHERGLGVPKDYAEALRWYRLAADQGMAAAQNNIGDFYETGRGVERDFAQAAAWYRKAADQGISVAQLSLGDFHRKGQGVAQNFAKAAEWYRLAAAQGLEAATQRLEEMYQAGEATRPRPGKARSSAARDGSPATKRRARNTSKNSKLAVSTAPPDAPSVARRAICLRALLRRCQIEASLAGSRKTSKARAVSPDPALAREARAINSWLKDVEVWPSLSDLEMAALKKKPGTWTVRELKDWGWRFEAFGVVAWALVLAPRIAPYDRQQGEASWFKTIPLLRSTRRFIVGAKLRPAVRIQKARDVAENWLWRARTTLIQKEPKKYPPPAGWTYEKIIKQAARHWEKQGLFKAVKRDYPAFGKPYASLNEEEWQTCSSIATERLYGLNWLCGYASNWDLVPTET